MLANEAAMSNLVNCKRQLSLELAADSFSPRDDGEETPPWDSASNLAEENIILKEKLLSLTFRCNDLGAEVSALEDELRAFESAAAPIRNSRAVANTVIVALQQELQAASEEDKGLDTVKAGRSSGGGDGGVRAALPLVPLLERAMSEVLDVVAMGAFVARKGSRSPPSRPLAHTSPPATPPRSHRASTSTNGAWVPFRAASERVSRRSSLGGCDRSPPRRGSLAAQNSVRQGHGSTAAAGARRGSARGAVGEDEEALHCQILAKAYLLRQGRGAPTVEAAGELLELKNRYSAATGKWLKTDFMDAEELQLARRRVIEILGEKKELLCAAAAAAAAAPLASATTGTGLAITNGAAARGAVSGTGARVAATGSAGEALFSERDETIAVLGGALELLRYRQLLDLLDAALRAGSEKIGGGVEGLKGGKRRAPADGSSPQIEAA